MLIEIVQHESNKIVREATFDEAKVFRQTFPVNLVDEHGNRTPFNPQEDAETGEPNAADEVNAEVDAIVANDAPAETESESEPAPESEA